MIFLLPVYVDTKFLGKILDQVLLCLLAVILQIVIRMLSQDLILLNTLFVLYKNWTKQ